MSVHVEYRQATQDEFHVLERQWLSPKLHALLMSAGAYLLYWLLAFSLLMTIAAITTAISIKMPHDENAWNPADWGPWLEGALIVALWGPVFVVPGIVAVRRYRRVVVRRLSVWKDRQEQCIEMIEFDGEPYTTIEDDRAGRFYVFDMPDGAALCLAMHNHFWLQRSSEAIEALEEVEDFTDDDLEEVLSRHLPAFPAWRFQVHRWPNTGVIIDIRVMAAEQEAEEVVVRGNISPEALKRFLPALGRDSTLIQVQRCMLR